MRSTIIASLLIGALLFGGTSVAYAGDSRADDNERHVAVQEIKEQILSLRDIVHDIRLLLVEIRQNRL